ncbi:MAG TPA: asparagine synthase (glutamine-hydrolyzing) [Pseudonocardia sp.]|nr:asparagine synthase (glutamine-hydrolyzing) [Pseudonocardia sp.]
MCGLLGLLTARADAPDRAAAVIDALHDGRHRGPDETGEWHDQDVLLGFNRLSIIDIDHSQQPLRWGPDGRYMLAFNGEIYNYLELREELRAEHGAQFHTDGDGEVIVAGFHYWGQDVVRRLRGMFAFLIWDTQERVLFGARDPFGIKPLFVHTGPAGTAFSSEKKSLLALLTPATGSVTIDQPALQHYLLLQYVPEPATMHREIRRIESGTLFTVRPGAEPVTERYFTPVFSPTPIRDAASRSALYGRITDVMRDSVAKHMRADVTVGAFLSGGIDSTAIAALAKEHNPDLITFTTGFERPGYSEVDVAAESAEAIGVRHVVRTVKPDEMMDALPLIVWYLDDPVADPALVPLWFIAREARQHVKVVLSGEGADELFGGYTIYREPLSLAPFEKVPGAVRNALGKLSTRIPEGIRGKDLLRRGALPLERRYYGNARIFRDDQLAAVLRQYDPRRSHTDITAQWYRRSVEWDPVSRMQHVDLFTWLRGDILVKADKMTMANSLELRVPFLDPEVFSVASTIPLSEKITGTNGSGTTKYALRKALEGIVPPHVLHRRKLGFPVPIRHWLRDELYEWAASIIAESQTEHLVNTGAVRRMLDEHRNGPIDHSRRLWTLLVFMIWHGIFVEERIRPTIPEPSYPVQV